MKKFPTIVCSILLSVLFSVNCAFSFDMERIQAVSEIGMLSNSQKYVQALDRCNSAIEKYPFEAELYYWRATVNMHLGESKQALKDIDMAIELNPNDSDVYVMRGIFKSENGDNDGALSDFEQAIKINSKNASAYSMRACVKIAKGDFKSANEDLEIANNLFEQDANLSSGIKEK